MRKTRFLAIAAVALLTVLSVASCGSSPTEPRVRVINPGPGPAPEPEPEPEPEPLPTITVSRILAFGDSLTQGASNGLPLSPWGASSHLNPETSYPSKLQEILDETYGTGKATVTNAGRGGETTIGSEAKDRLIEELDDHNPQVLLLMHGVNSLTNELLNGNEDAVDDTIDALDELIELAKDRKPGIAILLATLPQQDIEGSSKARAAYLVEPFNEQVRQLASEEGVTLVDIFEVISRSMLTPDGLHITEAGNSKMADAFYAKIKARFHRNPTLR